MPTSLPLVDVAAACPASASASAASVFTSSPRSQLAPVSFDQNTILVPGPSSERPGPTAAGAAPEPSTGLDDDDATTWGERGVRWVGRGSEVGVPVVVGVAGSGVGWAPSWRWGDPTFLLCGLSNRSERVMCITWR